MLFPGSSYCTTMAFPYSIYHSVTTCGWPYAMSIKWPHPVKVGSSWPWVMKTGDLAKTRSLACNTRLPVFAFPDFLLNPFWSFFVTLRYRIHHEPVCSGIWTLHSSGTCKGHRLPLGLESHYPHLALLTCMDWCSSPGLEQVHAGDPPTGLLFGLGL